MRCKAMCPICGTVYEIELPIKKFNNLKDKFDEVACLCDDCLERLEKNEEERKF